MTTYDLLIIITTLAPTFPLGAQISLAQVGTNSVLTGMTMACLTISRNMGIIIRQCVIQ